MSHQPILPVPRNARLLATVLATLLCSAWPAVTQAQAAKPANPPSSAHAQLSFDTAQAAVDALVRAVQGGSRSALAGVLGPAADRVLDSGDPQQDEKSRENFLRSHQEAAVLEHDGPAKVTLLLGQAQWPLPFPLVQTGQRWRFDTRAGVQQVLDRQIGANELAVMAVLETYVLAQREYAQRDRNSNGLLEYAQRMVSSEGQRDGLYWPTAAGEPASPMGARFALAHLGPYRGSDDAPQAFNGYYYRPLTSQGRNAAGGAYDYLVTGRQIGGFALIATPARHGVSGLMTFMVNHDGVVFSKNLGPQTTAVAARLTRFNPDATWKREDLP